MPEYTIKLDVDATELARKIQSATSSGGIMRLGMVGGGAAGGAQIQIIKALQKQTEQYKQGIVGRFGPSLVKLAGFSIGLAGMMQFRKMLIDSSPMLQGMLKIMNTSFQLVLRPLGDFIGFFMLPLAIGMLHFAVPFYQTFATKYGAFYAAGEAFFKGDLGTGWCLAATAFTDALSEFLGVRPTEGPTTSATIEGISPPLFGPLQNKIGQDIWDWMLKNFFGKESTIQFPGSAYACTGIGGTNYQVNLQDSVGILGGTTTEHKTAEEIARENAITEQLKLDQTNLSLDYLECAALAFKNIQEIVEAIAAGPMSDSDKAALDMLRYVRNMKLSGKQSAEAMIETAIIFDTTATRVSQILAQYAGLTTRSGHNVSGLGGTNPFPVGGGGGGGSGGSSVIAAPKFVSYKDAIGTLQGAWAYSKALFDKGQGQFGYQNLNPHLFGGIGNVATWDVLKEWSQFGESGIQDLRDRGIIKFARGGILREPVFGVGASGQSYQFGERGPEQITPVGGTKGGGGNLYISVSGIRDVTEFESKLRPMVMRWLKEAKANRGIL